MDVIRNFGISKMDRILEIGCGEGRDAGCLMKTGYNVIATDISEEAITFCRKEWPEYAACFRVLDCVTESMQEKFDFLYAVAVLHMLVLDEDRRGFYRFVRTHLKDSGIALICSMGDGTQEICSDISSAFDLQERIHEETGRILQIAGTSYRGISFETFHKELRDNQLEILQEGFINVEPDYGKMMYVVVKKG